MLQKFQAQSNYNDLSSIFGKLRRQQLNPAKFSMKVSDILLLKYCILSLQPKKSEFEATNSLWDHTCSI